MKQLLGYTEYSQLERALALGVDRNIIVYDSDAAPDIFSKRLIALMKTVFRRNSTNRSKIMTDLYIPEWAEPDYELWMGDFGVNNVVTQSGNYQEVFACNVSLHFIEMDRLRDKFLNEHNAMCAPGDNNIVIGINRFAEYLDPQGVLLGSY